MNLASRFFMFRYFDIWQAKSWMLSGECCGFCCQVLSLRCFRFLLPVMILAVYVLLLGLLLPPSNWYTFTPPVRLAEWTWIQMTSTLPFLSCIQNVLPDKDATPKMPTWWLKHVEACPRCIIQRCHRCFIYFTNCVKHKTHIRTLNLSWQGWFQGIPAGFTID
jgi:hypothetical protein